MDGTRRASASVILRLEIHDTVLKLLQRVFLPTVKIYMPQKVSGMIGFEAAPLIQVSLIGPARKRFMKFLDHRRIVKNGSKAKNKSLAFRSG